MILKKLINKIIVYYVIVHATTHKNVERGVSSCNSASVPDYQSGSRYSIISSLFFGVAQNLVPNLATVSQDI